MFGIARKYGCVVVVNQINGVAFHACQFLQMNVFKQKLDMWI